MRVSVEYEWRAIGQVGVTAGGRVAIPHVPEEPGIFRLRVTNGANVEVAVGESQSLGRRLQGDYVSDSVDAANLRVRQQLQEDLDRGSLVELAIVTSVIVRVNSVEVPADLATVSVRLLVENAAIAAERASGATLRTR